MNYIPLNVETYYSFLQSAIKIDDYINAAKELSLNYLGICDDNPYAFAEFSKKCKENNIVPILGCKINYLYKNTDVLLYVYIQSETGYKDFCKLYNKVSNNTLSDELNEHYDLICVIETSNYSNMNLLNHLKEVFKKLFIGLECYSKKDLSDNIKIEEFLEKHGFHTISFPKIKAISKHDGQILNILNAIKNEQKLLETNKSDTPYFLLSDSSIKKIYSSKSIENLSLFYNTDFQLIKKRGSLPCFKIENKHEYLYNLAFSSLKSKNLDNDIYINRLKYEIEIIDKMGYLDYFLIVYHYVNTAKKNNIYVGPGRGSAAGSLFSYALGITEIDPIKYNLLFERFLNPERITMPDIDVDFADYRRNDVIKIIENKYSQERVKPIITFQTFGAKQAIRDIGKVFNFNISDINLICKSLNKATTFDEALNIKDFQELLKESHYQKIVNLARQIEGYPRQKGIHAAGIIINNDPLRFVLPLSKDSSSVPFEAYYLEELGFLKMDVLALKNLTLIEQMIKEIKITHNDFSLKDIPLADKKTFEVLNSGYTKSIFQLESEGITNAIKLVHIDSFDDLICLNALYRPGPMDNIEIYAKRKLNKEKIDYINDNLKPILKETYGIIVYQEQIMLIVCKVANFTLGKADILRRAISKKDETKIMSLKEDFISGATNNNYTLKEATTIFDYILKFANYGFNKSHSVSYSLITYQMAYIKANYPREFFKVILDNQKMSENRFFSILNELKYFNIKLLNPSINKSCNNYTIEGDNIRLPFGEIKDINQEIENKIINEKKSNNYVDYEDFLMRIIPYSIKENQIVNLINAGVFDEFKHTRKTLRENLNNYLLFIKNFPKPDIFTKSEIDCLKPKLIEFKENIEEKNSLEIDCLSILLSDNLFSKYQNYIKNNKIKTINDSFLHKNKNISIIAKISKIREITTKNNEKMILIYCYDNYNQIKAVVFPNNYQNVQNIEINDTIILKGMLKEDKKGTNFIADNVLKMEDTYE